MERSELYKKIGGEFLNMLEEETETLLGQAVVRRMCSRITTLFKGEIPSVAMMFMVWSSIYIVAGKRVATLKEEAVKLAKKGEL